MWVVRSAYAHGRIVSIDAADALALPGVVAVWTASDIPEIAPIKLRDADPLQLELVSAAGAGARAGALCR